MSSVERSVERLSKGEAFEGFTPESPEDYGSFATMKGETLLNTTFLVPLTCLHLWPILWAILEQEAGAHFVNWMSYTQVSTYLECPLEYRLRYIDHLPAKPKGYFSFGSTLHRCLAFYFQKRRPPSLARLISFYEEAWSSRGYPSPEEEARDKALGTKILTQFWESHNPDYRRSLATERSFLVDLGGAYLKGVIDRVDVSDGGGLCLTDYKSGKDFPSPQDMEADLQLTLYQLAAQSLWLLPLEKLAIYHLRYNIPVECRPRSRDRLEDARRLVLDVQDGIQQRQFPPRRHRFCPCDYPERCPHFS